ncbi:MAG: hypothetical protein U0Q11_19420 [Vicinamibacterales bacterium]
MRPSVSAPAPRFYGALLLLVFAYLTYARVHDATNSFLLLRDQMRDWTIALGTFRSLPLTGTQSTAGGSSLGPIYYWVLWLSRVVIGPVVHNLPQAGAYGIATLQGTADLLLLDSLRRRTGSTWVALAATLLGATASHELAVSSTIWNPAVSVAFVKLAIALRLRRDTDASLWWTVAATACAWFAVQAHSAAIFVAVPVAASYVLDDVVKGRIVRALQQTRAIVETIVLLQVPFLVSALTQAGDVAPTRALGNASDAMATGLRWKSSLLALIEYVTQILFAPWISTIWIPVLALGSLIVVLRARRDLPMLCTTIVPLVLAVAGLAMWQGNYDSYWYLPLAPCASVMLALAFTTWIPTVSGALIVVVLLVAQPFRITESMRTYRMPQYGAILRGTERVVRQTKQLRRLTTSFPLPPFADETYLFAILGGELTDTAEFDAVIDERGDVQFSRVAR